MNHNTQCGILDYYPAQALSAQTSQ